MQHRSAEVGASVGVCVCLCGAGTEVACSCISVQDSSMAVEPVLCGRVVIVL